MGELRSLPQPASPASVYEAYRQLVALYFQTDRCSIDLLLSDLDIQLLARLPTYQHALTSGKSFTSILAGLRKLNDTLGESSRKAPIGSSTGDSDDSALPLGRLDRIRLLGVPDSPPSGPGTFIRTDHIAQQPSLRRLDGSALRCALSCTLSCFVVTHAVPPVCDQCLQTEGSIFGSRQGARCSSVFCILPYCDFQKTG